MHFANCKKPDSKATYCVTLFIRHSKKGKTRRKKTRIVVARNSDEERV